MRLINPHRPQKNFGVQVGFSQTGFSLVELMVGLVIGLLATLVIMQVFSAFEGQKRTTSGTADAQTSGSVGLYSLQRDVQLAGYGLPLYDAANMPLNCAVTPTVDHDGDGGALTPAISLSPFEITNGATATDSDTITVRYGTSENGGIPVPVIGAPVGLLANINNNMACLNNDVVYTVTATNCAATRVNDVRLAPVGTRLAANFTNITLATMPASVQDKTSLSCITGWTEIRFGVDNNNQLTRLNTLNNITPTPVVAGIVNMQAQYGVSAIATSNQITQWVNATGIWAPAALTPANRNRIKALRVAIVARNDLLERLPAVSAACSSTTAANPTGVCAWDATSANPITASPAPAIDLSNTANWNQYRYKVYETIIPIRNMVWTRARL
ncbi:PilW family protein [Methylotenera sp.]|uniref:PilW family protein n=1 Tax=Methylotenera sp. TaxID=2051956 RepID=UPI00272C4E4A|nr:PilW family protein [Methylotenera sp.]MDP3006142.1 PilW family protein [Methylotenera sp.]